MCIYIHICIVFFDFFDMYMAPYVLCMYVSMYVCMSVCLYVCMSVCLYVCMSVCLYVCMSVCMHACMHACMDGWMDGWMYVCRQAGRQAYYIQFICVASADPNQRHVNILLTPRIRLYSRTDSGMSKTSQRNHKVGNDAKNCRPGLVANMVLTPI